MTPTRNAVQAGCDVALVISDLGGGGAQRVATTLANAWAREGRRVAVLTLAAPETDLFFVDPSVARHHLGGIGDSQGLVSKLGANLRRIIALRRALQIASPKVSVGFISPTNILLIIAATGLGMRVVISERNDPARQSFGLAWNVLRRLLYRFADVVTANSHSALDTMRAYVPAGKLAFAPNPVPPPSDGPTAELDAPTILAVGRLHRQKAYDVLLAAFALFAEGSPDWRLVVLGDGPLREALEARARDDGISPRVAFRGRVSDPYPYYRSADIFVLASRYEGMPNALLEAMSCGLPSIVTDASSGPLEYVAHEVTGLVVPTEDSLALAAAMDRLAGSRDLRRRLGLAAKARIADDGFTLAQITWESVLGFEPKEFRELAR